MIVNLYNEIWADIKGFEGLYQASNMGRVKALAREWFCGHGNLQKRVKGESLLSSHTDRQGYLKVNLCKNGKESHHLVHRLIASTFIPNNENKPEVNHRFGIKSDNRASELEWNTPTENMQHAHKTGIKKGTFGGKNGWAKIVLDTGTGIFYDCLKDAAVAKNVDYIKLSKQLSGNSINKTSMIYA